VGRRTVILRVLRMPVELDLRRLTLGASKFFIVRACTVALLLGGLFAGCKNSHSAAAPTAPSAPDVVQWVEIVGPDTVHAGERVQF
jgi:hypothetical protein